MLSFRLPCMSVGETLRCVFDQTRAKVETTAPKANKWNITLIEPFVRHTKEVSRFLH